MNNLPLKPLVWHDASNSDLYAEGANYHYDVAEDRGSYYVRYLSKDFEANMKRATGFATIDEAKAWVWKHYNEKMQPYVKPDSITDIRNWFKAAKPEPTFSDAMTQYGCHIEEVCEMLDAMGDRIEAHQLTQLADWYKQTEYKDRPKPYTTNIELLDALCDQIVTATGVAYMMGFDIEGALKEVIRSNNSKMVDGRFIFDENAKIAKPDSYSEPDLIPFISTMQNNKGE